MIRMLNRCLKLYSSVDQHCALGKENKLGFKKTGLSLELVEFAGGELKPSVDDGAGDLGSVAELRQPSNALDLLPEQPVKKINQC